jgi:hypothetical protein
VENDAAPEGCELKSKESAGSADSLQLLEHSKSIFMRYVIDSVKTEQDERKKLSGQILMALASQTKTGLS